MRLKACICNCVKSLKIGGISPMMQPLKNCAFSLCETLTKIGKCRPDIETGRQSVCNFIRWTLYECHEVILVTWPLTQNSGHYQFRPWTDRRFQTTVGACRPSRSRPFHRTTGRLDHGPPSAFPTARSDRPPGKIDRCSTDENGQP